MADIAGLTNGLNTVTNSTQKAQILIIDRRSPGLVTVTKKAAVDPGSASALSGMGVKVPAAAQSALSDLEKTVEDKVTEAIEDVVDKATGGVIKTMSYDKVFTVQFNPASLRLNGFSGGAREAVDFTSKERGRSAQTRPLDTTITMSVNLIFDQMNLAHSFPMDTLDTSLTASAIKMIKGVTESIKGYSISVQAAVEGLIGVLRNPNTREICFSWGSLAYKGVLRQVNATYTMFDMLGRPVRAQVGLSLYLMDKEIKSAGKNNNLGVWTKAYNSAFADSTAYGTTVAEKAKKWSGILMG